VGEERNGEEEEEEGEGGTRALGDISAEKNGIIAPHL